MPFPFLGEDLELNETTRRTAPGSFVRLPEGMTHYELAGPPDALPVVLVHGFSVPYFIFDPTFEFLVSAGFRVLRYDLFGRGWSDRPALPNDIGLFIRQLHNLLAGLEITRPVVAAGLSMGGPISAAFTVQYPGSVAANILIDPAGTHPIELGALELASLPVVGEVVLGLFGGERLVKNIASDFFDRSLVEYFQERYRVQMHYSGFRRSILSTLRNRMLGDFSGVYKELGRLAKPALLVWGREDRTVPFAHAADLVRLLPGSELRVIEASGHLPHCEKPDEVNPILREFLEDV
jgi:pimeloyl-ACP methyl ester carboxylesterase